MSLEDGLPDIVAKAMLGLGLDAAGLAENSGLGIGSIEAILRGDSDVDSLREIAPFLGLDADALAGLPGYLPQRQDLAGVSRLILPFGEWTVNAWLVEHGGFRLLFDTGYGADDLLAALGGIIPDVVFITHAHVDHVGGIPTLEARGARVISETEASETSRFGFGGISIRALDLAGHMTPAAGYLIDGLGKRLLVPGDAIFAGSIGRCRSTAAYGTALTNLRRALAEAGGDCVILPGHGPATTVAEELVANPFLWMTADITTHTAKHLR